MSSFVTRHFLKIDLSISEANAEPLYELLLFCAGYNTGVAYMALESILP